MKKATVGTALLAMLGCGANLTGARLGSSPDGPPAIRTTEASYTLTDEGWTWHLTVVATYTNNTGHTVYAQTFGSPKPGYSLEKLEGGQWKPALDPAVPLVATPPLVLRNGESRTDTLGFTAVKPEHNGEPKFEVDSVPGTYRVVYDLFSTAQVNDYVYQLSDSLPKTQRVSNTFQLQ